VSGLDETLIREITERVTREVLSALTDETTVPSVSDEWPDYDEYGHEPQDVVVADLDSGAPNPSPEPETVEPPPRPSVLRQMARGQTELSVVGYTEDGEEISPYSAGMTGDVLPIGIEGARGGGFDPRTSPDWYARQRQRDMALRRVAPWESQVKAV
jgi:hypothetical protein